MASWKPLFECTLDPLPVEADVEQIIRFLGYPVTAKPDPRILKRVNRVAAEAKQYGNPRGVYAVYSLEGREENLIRLGGTEIAGPVGDFLRAAEKIAIFVVTAGAGLTEQIERVNRGSDVLEAMVWDALGSHLADRACDALAEELRRRHVGHSEGLTPPYSPGYCGMEMDQQRPLFSLVDAASIGVELLPTFIMKPIKSVSGLVGIGPSGEVEASGSPCERCDRENCNMRR